MTVLKTGKPENVNEQSLFEVFSPFTLVQLLLFVFHWLMYSMFYCALQSSNQSICSIVLKPNYAWYTMGVWHGVRSMVRFEGPFYSISGDPNYSMWLCGPARGNLGKLFYIESRQHTTVENRNRLQHEICPWVIVTGGHLHLNWLFTLTLMP